MLSQFLKEHNLAEPKNVEFSPLPYCRSQVCFQNVEKQVQMAGGRMETGWVFWEYEDIEVRTEAHAIWISPQGGRRDITPRALHNERRILFLPDASVAIKRGITAGYTTILSSDPMLRAVCGYGIEVDRIFDEHWPGLNKEWELPLPLLRDAAKRVGLPEDVAWHIACSKRDNFTRPLN